MGREFEFSRPAQENQRVIKSRLVRLFVFLYFGKKFGKKQFGDV
jgi:hypothetical protein